MGKKFEIVHPNAAGIDIGSSHIYVDAGGDSVKCFETFTDSLHTASKYLLEMGITTVAMEATGVYWVVLYDILENAGINVWLVNGRDVKNVPGRKSDVSDCQWIRQLHSYGLLRKSFIPENTIRELRGYMRLREDHIRSGAREINHMDKVLVLMNIRLSSVLSSLNSKTGITLIEAILNGEREPEVLVELCDIRVLKTKKAQVLASLKGNFQTQYIFALKQAYNAWCFFEKQIQECDKEIGTLLTALNQDKELIDDEITSAKLIRRHAPQIKHLHVQMLLLSGGKDVTALPGITDYTALQIFSEIGTDMTPWPTEKNFTSWLGLSPGKNKSGKVDKKTKGYKKTNVGNIFRQAAQSLLISKYNALGAFGRRIRSRKGPFVAIKATARKLACMFYRVMTKGIKYVEQGVEKYEEKYKAVLVSKLQKQASALNLKLVPAS
jgi:transposase